MSIETACAHCHRIGDACICGSDRRHFTCSACRQDVNRYQARWITSEQLEEPVPVHDACVGRCLERFSDMKFVAAPNLEAPDFVSPKVATQPDPDAPAAFIFAAPLHIRVEGKASEIAQKAQNRLIEVFDALRTGAQRASFVLDPATGEVKVTGFAEVVDALLRPRSELPN